jgi:hypothetical protein
MTYRKTLALSVVAAALVLVGCASVQSQWKTAVATNTIDGYQTFATKHARSTYADSAQLAMERLKFQAADRENTVAAYQGFMKENPKSPLVAKANDRIDELEFKAATAMNTVAGYMDFIAKHPASPRIATAQQNMDRRRAEVVAAEPAGAQAALARHPAAAKKGPIPAKYVGNWVFRHFPDGATVGYLVITSSCIIMNKIIEADSLEAVFKPGSYEVGAKGLEFTYKGEAGATTAAGDTIKIPIPITLTVQPDGLRVDFGQGQVTVKGKLADMHLLEDVQAVQLKDKVKLTAPAWDFLYRKAGS